MACLIQHSGAFVHRAGGVEVDLFLDDILVEHLIVELQRLCIDQLVVQSLADRLDDVALGKRRVLLTLLAWPDVFFLKFELVLKSIVDMVFEAFGRRAEKPIDALVVELFHHLVEDVSVELAPLLLQLLHHLLELGLHAVYFIVHQLVLVLQVRGLGVVGLGAVVRVSRRHVLLG